MSKHKEKNKDRSRSRSKSRDRRERKKYVIFFSQFTRLDAILIFFIV